MISTAASPKLEWFTQCNLGSMNSATVTFVNDRIAISGITAALSPAVLQKEGIKSILCLEKCHEKSAMAELQAAEPNKLAECLIVEGDRPHPKLVEAGIARVRVTPIRELNQLASETYQAVIDDLAVLVRDCAPVLVCCALGQSRSPSMVAAFLAQTQSLSFQEALEAVGQTRNTIVDPILAHDLARKMGLRMAC